MADAPPLYATRAFVDAFVDALNADPAFQKAARGFRDAITIRVWDRPDGMDCTTTYRIDRGRVTVDDFREAPTPAPFRSEPYAKGSALVRSTAPFRVWTKLDRGEMNPLQALASPEYSVEGPKLKIMTNIGVVNAMNAVASRTPKSFG